MRVSSCFPVATSQMITVLSPLAVAILVPSGLKAAYWTVSVWPVRVIDLVDELATLVGLSCRVSSTVATVAVVTIATAPTTTRRAWVEGALW